MEFQYHEALTIPVLKAHGFTPGAQALVLAGNWSSDLWTLGPLATTERGRDVRRFHFTELPTPQAIADRWTWLAERAARTLPTLTSQVALLYELGQLLHCVQDFYAHTNWVELCLREGISPARVPTWEEGLPRAALEAELLSAYFPDYTAPRPALRHSILHKDHPFCTPGAIAFQAAMATAARATRAWLPRLLAEVPPARRASLLRVSQIPVASRLLLATLGWLDRKGLCRWLGGGPPPWYTPARVGGRAPLLVAGLPDERQADGSHSPEKGQRPSRAA